MPPKAYKCLKARIAQRGLTYGDLSGQTGIPLGSLCAKINGYASFNSREATLLCRALDIPAEEVFVFF